MIDTLFQKSLNHPIMPLVIVGFVGGWAVGLPYGFWNALMGGVFGVMLMLLFVVGKPMTAADQ